MARWPKKKRLEWGQRMQQARQHSLEMQAWEVEMGIPEMIAYQPTLNRRANHAQEETNIEETKACRSCPNQHAFRFCAGRCEVSRHSRLFQYGMDK